MSLFKESAASIKGFFQQAGEDTMSFLRENNIYLNNEKEMMLSDIENGQAEFKNLGNKGSPTVNVQFPSLPEGHPLKSMTFEYASGNEDACWKVDLADKHTLFMKKYTSVQNMQPQLFYPDKNDPENKASKNKCPFGGGVIEAIHHKIYDGVEGWAYSPEGIEQGLAHRNDEMMKSPPAKAQKL